MTGGAGQPSIFTGVVGARGASVPATPFDLLISCGDYGMKVSVPSKAIRLLVLSFNDIVSFTIHEKEKDAEKAESGRPRQRQTGAPLFQAKQRVSYFFSCTKDFAKEIDMPLLDMRRGGTEGKLVGSLRVVIHCVDQSLSAAMGSDSQVSKSVESRFKKRLARAVERYVEVKESCQFLPIALEEEKDRGQRKGEGKKNSADAPSVTLPASSHPPFLNPSGHTPGSVSAHPSVSQVHYPEGNPPAPTEGVPPTAPSSFHQNTFSKAHDHISSAQFQGAPAAGLVGGFEGSMLMNANTSTGFGPARGQHRSAERTRPVEAPSPSFFESQQPTRQKSAPRLSGSLSTGGGGSSSLSHSFLPPPFLQPPTRQVESEREEMPPPSVLVVHHSNASASAAALSPTAPTQTSMLQLGHRASPLHPHSPPPPLPPHDLAASQFIPPDSNRLPPHANAHFHGVHIRSAAQQQSLTPPSSFVPPFPPHALLPLPRDPTGGRGVPVSSASGAIARSSVYGPSPPSSIRSPPPPQTIPANHFPQAVQPVPPHITSSIPQQVNPSSAQMVMQHHWQQQQGNNVGGPVSRLSYGLTIRSTGAAPHPHPPMHPCAYPQMQMQTMVQPQAQVQTTTQTGLSVSHHQPSESCLSRSVTDDLRLPTSAGSVVGARAAAGSCQPTPVTQATQPVDDQPVVSPLASSRMHQAHEEGEGENKYEMNDNHACISSVPVPSFASVLQEGAYGRKRSLSRERGALRGASQTDPRDSLIQLSSSSVRVQTPGRAAGHQIVGTGSALPFSSSEWDKKYVESRPAQQQDEPRREVQMRSIVCPVVQPVVSASEDRLLENTEKEGKRAEGFCDEEGGEAAPSASWCCDSRPRPGAHEEREKVTMPPLPLTELMAAACTSGVHEVDRVGGEGWDGMGAGEGDGSSSSLYSSSSTRLPGHVSHLSVNRSALVEVGGERGKGKLRGELEEPEPALPGTSVHITMGGGEDAVFPPQHGSLPLCQASASSSSSSSSGQTEKDMGQKGGVYGQKGKRGAEGVPVQVSSLDKKKNGKGGEKSAVHISSTGSGSGGKSALGGKNGKRGTAGSLHLRSQKENRKNSEKPAPLPSNPYPEETTPVQPTPSNDTAFLSLAPPTSSPPKQIEVGEHIESQEGDTGIAHGPEEPRQPLSFPLADPQFESRGTEVEEAALVSDVKQKETDLGPIRPEQHAGCEEGDHQRTSFDPPNPPEAEGNPSVLSEADAEAPQSQAVPPQSRRTLPLGAAREEDRPEAARDMAAVARRLLSVCRRAGFPAGAQSIDIGFGGLSLEALNLPISEQCHASSGQLDGPLGGLGEGEIGGSGAPPSPPLDAGPFWSARGERDREGTEECRRGEWERERESGGGGGLPRLSALPLPSSGAGGNMNMYAEADSWGEGELPEASARLEPVAESHEEEEEEGEDASGNVDVQKVGEGGGVLEMEERQDEKARKGEGNLVSSSAPSGESFEEALQPYKDLILVLERKLEKMNVLEAQCTSLRVESSRLRQREEERDASERVQEEEERALSLSLSARQRGSAQTEREEGAEDHASSAALRLCTSKAVGAPESGGGKLSDLVKEVLKRNEELENELEQSRQKLSHSSEAADGPGGVGREKGKRSALQGGPAGAGLGAGRGSRRSPFPPFSSSSRSLSLGDDPLPSSNCGSSSNDSTTACTLSLSSSLKARLAEREAELETERGRREEKEAEAANLSRQCAAFRAQNLDLATAVNRAKEESRASADSLEEIVKLKDLKIDEMRKALKTLSADRDRVEREQAERVARLEKKLSDRDRQEMERKERQKQPEAGPGAAAAAEREGEGEDVALPRCTSTLSLSWGDLNLAWESVMRASPDSLRETLGNFETHTCGEGQGEDVLLGLSLFPSPPSGSSGLAEGGGSVQVERAGRMLEGLIGWALQRAAMDSEEAVGGCASFVKKETEAETEEKEVQVSLRCPAVERELEGLRHQISTLRDRVTQTKSRSERESVNGACQSISSVGVEVQTQTQTRQEGDGGFAGEGADASAAMSMREEQLSGALSRVEELEAAQARDKEGLRRLKTRVDSLEGIRANLQAELDSERAAFTDSNLALERMGERFDERLSHWQASKGALERELRDRAAASAHLVRFVRRRERRWREMVDREREREREMEGAWKGRESAPLEGDANALLLLPEKPGGARRLEASNSMGVSPEGDGQQQQQQGSSVSPESVETGLRGNWMYALSRFHSSRRERGESLEPLPHVALDGQEADEVDLALDEGARRSGGAVGGGGGMDLSSLCGHRGVRMGVGGGGAAGGVSKAAGALGGRQGPSHPPISKVARGLYLLWGQYCQVACCNGSIQVWDLSSPSLGVPSSLEAFSSMQAGAYGGQGGVDCGSLGSDAGEGEGEGSVDPAGPPLGACPSPAEAAEGGGEGEPFLEPPHAGARSLSHHHQTSLAGIDAFELEAAQSGGIPEC
uniref:Uncharacterized protein n=1 Tax=Chromera velia CCMP2878 TaxID=1169474 RepID=A0A0G4H226_9ALVE|eukprot:Cvel_5543.t1-p1 / transcript=Cvel_5543.t1 / gene=Cvel_5543 / organism=Chromera_velia_CCMP2878 / gene_product=hypothetical protein / transcript_product=hypothetical protein / location=Cvel_scaffold260:3783-15379(+) / protein_length=2454 / sequence_SO=supercontig / SO=protein_coding / is_pseudo=false